MAANAHVAPPDRTLERRTLDVYFSTVSRSAPLESGGELVKLDWGAKRVVGAVPITPANRDVVDPNPRGGARGGRGIALLGDQVVVAAQDSLVIHDRELNEIERASHPLMSGLHEVADPGDGTLWLTATSIDAALRYDLATGQVTDQRWPREHPPLRAQLDIEPLEIDHTADQRQRWLLLKPRQDFGHLHLNAIALRGEQLLGLCNHSEVILDLGTNEVLVRDPGLGGAHNLVILDDGSVLTSDTAHGAVIRWDLDSGQAIGRISLLSFPWVRAHERRHRMAFALGRAARRAHLRRRPPAHPLFVRGMARQGDVAFVGISPAAIVAFDWRTGTFIDAFAYSHDVHLCIHGLALAP